MPTGIPVGIVEDFEYKQNRITLEQGDLMICYTDGITEAVNAAEEEFGMKRLEKVVMNHQNDSVEAIAAAVKQAVENFSLSEKQFDDITILVIKRTGDNTLISMKP